MPYSGGSATNTGVLYQNWYLALLIAYAFFEPEYILFPESLKKTGVVVDDVQYTNRFGTTFCSIKFRSPSKTLHWRQADLKSQGIFDDFREQHIANSAAKIVLVSESNCYLFAEVFQRVKNARTPNEIYDVLQSDFAIDEWEKAKENLRFDDYELLKFAKQVEVICVPLEEIKNLVKHRFDRLGNGNQLKNLLFTKAVDCSSKKTRIDIVEINKWLEEEGIDFNS